MRKRPGATHAAILSRSPIKSQPSGCRPLFHTTCSAPSKPLLTHAHDSPNNIELSHNSTSSRPTQPLNSQQLGLAPGIAYTALDCP